MPKPPLELAVEVTGANGTQYRWGSGKRAGDVPQGLSFKTKQSEGFADASLTLSRRIDREYVDLNLLDSVVISGADGSIAYEGRVAALPRSMQQTHQVSVQCVGWMAHTRDRKLSEIYVDRDLGGWGDPSLARRSGLTIGNFRVDTAQVTADSTNRPGVRLGFTGPWATPFKPIAVGLYDAGSGNKIAKIYYDRSTFNNITVGDANWVLEFQWSASDAMSSPEIQSFRTNAATYLDAVTPGRFVEANTYFNVTPGGVTDQTYEVYLRNLTVYGDHGIPLLAGVETADPAGVPASGVIKHAIGKYCPALNTAGVQTTTHPIGQLVFKDRTDPYDVLLEVNKYHLWQLAVYENRTLNYWPLDMSDYDWEVRLSDHGTTVDLQGDSTNDLANGIVVQYDDLGAHRPNTLTPDDYSELRDPNESNPATLAGLNKWTEIRLSSPAFQADALQLGRAALAEWNQPKSPGTINVQGHIRDRAGHWQPVWKVRNGDRIIISDHANDRPRLVVETDYQHDPKTISIAVDSSFKRLDAVLDRQGTALKAAGLAA